MASRERRARPATRAVPATPPRTSVAPERGDAARPGSDGDGGAEPVAVGVLREAVRDAVIATSLRAVAADVGMSFSGLRSFLDGGTPFRRTARRLEVWYRRDGSRPRDPNTQGEDEHRGEERGLRLTRRGTRVMDAPTAAALLVAHLPTTAQPVVLARIAEVLATASAAAGLPTPPWVRALGADASRSRRTRAGSAAREAVDTDDP